MFRNPFQPNITSKQSQRSPRPPSIALRGCQLSQIFTVHIHAEMKISQISHHLHPQTTASNLQTSHIGCHKGESLKSEPLSTSMASNIHSIETNLTSETTLSEPPGMQVSPKQLFRFQLLLDRKSEGWIFLPN